MNKIKSNIDLSKLLDEIRQLPFKLDGSGAYMALAQSTRVSELRSIFYTALDEISRMRSQPAFYLTINNLPPGVIVPIHTDTLKPTTFQNYRPQVERWHLPVITNADCWWWGEDSGRDKIHLEAGFWHGPMIYWKKHSVGNEGVTERIHFVVDLDTP